MQTLVDVETREVLCFVCFDGGFTISLANLDEERGSRVTKPTPAYKQVAPQSEVFLVFGALMLLRYLGTSNSIVSLSEPG